MAAKKKVTAAPEELGADNKKKALETALLQIEKKSKQFLLREKGLFNP